ncbi:MAG: hypothetical protein KME38_28820 [Spirirestis rafaelensis WJT71-NPBG6]|jgi:hypothetical protein|nr:hypothetical protein [Spirirestis rafaelensis WJT71-NPBG6]
MYIVDETLKMMPGRPRRDDATERANLKLNSDIRKQLKTQAIFGSRSESAQVERLVMESIAWKRFLDKHPDLTNEVNAEIAAVIMELKGEGND